MSMTPEQAAEWLRAAAEDGWTFTPGGSDAEAAIRALLDGETHALSGKSPEGFTNAMNLHGPPGAEPKRIMWAVWGPDGLACPHTPETYPGREGMAALLETCPECGKEGEPTFRYFFAGRACKDCVRPLRQKYERPGWTR